MIDQPIASEQELPTHTTEPKETDDLEHSARRGAVFIPIAKVWFMLSAFLLQVLLPRVLGSAALYGLFTLVSSWFSTVNNVMVTGTIQTVAFFAARGPAAVEEAKRTALRMNVLLGGGACLLLVLLSPSIADFEHDPELIAPLRLGALIVLGYSFYAVFVGAANGARQFHKQAGLDMAFAALRVGLVLLFALLWRDVLWAVGGWVVAAAVILGVAIAVMGWPGLRARGAAPPLKIRAMLGFGGPLSLYLLSQNALLFLDGWWLKRLYTEALSSLPSAQAKQTVDAMVGVYGAAQTVARLPYQLIVAVAFVVFPLLSAPVLAQDPERTRRYITATLRYSLIASVGLCVALAARPQATLRLLFPPEYAVASGALGLLLWAYVCLGLFSIVATIMNSLGRTVPTVILGFVTLLTTALSVWCCIHAALAAGEQPLRAAALGLLLGFLFGLAVGLLYLWRSLRVLLPIWSVVRVSLAAAAALALGQVWPLHGKVGTLVCACAALAVYLGAVFAMRELSLAEILSARRRG